MLFFDNKHKVSQELHALRDKCNMLENDIDELSKLVLSVAKAVERREKIETRKDIDDEILIAMLAKGAKDRTH